MSLSPPPTITQPPTIPIPPTPHPLNTNASTHFESRPAQSSSSFVTFLKDGEHSNGALKAAATAMRHSSKVQASAAYHKGGHDKIIAAAMQVAVSFASRFSAKAGSSSVA